MSDECICGYVKRDPGNWYRHRKTCSGLMVEKKLRNEFESTKAELESTSADLERLKAIQSMENTEKQLDIQDENPVRGTKRQRIQEVFITIYALIFVPTNKIVYIGKTNDTERREKEHGSKHSTCRLVVQAFLKHGRENFTLKPLLKCKAQDADCNESFMIMHHKTLYDMTTNPDGLNLRHGSKAGESSSFPLVPSCTGVVPYSGVTDETHAFCDAWADIAGMLQHAETRNTVKDLADAQLRAVHPDKVGDKTFTSEEVTAMILEFRNAA